MLIPPDRADGVFPRLNIGVTFCQVRHGQSKGIERAFGTICRRFSRFFQTWTGNLPTAKPHGLAERIKAGKAPTFDELAELFTWWVENDYHAMPHQGDGMNGLSPNEVWQSHPYVKRTSSPELMNLLLCPRLGPVKVHQNGVTWQTMQYGQHSRELFALLGKEVWLRVDGPQQLTVWDKEDRLICVAPCNRKLPVLADKQMVREAMAQKHQRNRLAKEYHAIRPRLHEPIEKQLAAMVAGKRAELERAGRQVPPPNSDPPRPDRIAPVRSGLESQLKALQQLHELPAAVGAESLTLAEVSRRLQQDRTQAPNDSGGSNAFARLGLALHTEDTQ